MMKISRPAALIPTAALFAGLATGCATMGSHDAQVASWRRQLERNPDARIERSPPTAAYVNSRDLDAVTDRAAAEMTFGILMILLGGIR